jgi:bacteriorhodopsin
MTNNDISITNNQNNDESITNIKIQHNDNYYVKISFYITYIFLLTTGTITFIEAITTKSSTVRNVMNLETAISVIAGYFYSTFVEEIKDSQKNNKIIDWTKLTTTRYIDWSMTTPLMLIVLCLVLSNNIEKKLSLKVITGVIILNYTMLLLGYLAEVNYMDRLYSLIFGFIAFFGLFYLIFINYIAPKYMKANYILFYFFLIVWAFYGIVFMFNEEYKNLAMNLLDCISKCLVGIGFWFYFTKIFVW